MLTFLALTVIPLVILVLILLFAIWLANRLAYRMVGSKHHLLDEILRTGEVPAAWRTRPLRWRPDQPELLAADWARNQKLYLARLDDLIAYAETTPLVDDEDTRDVLLDRLDEIRAAWAGQDVSAR
jgi:non-ribosomal peptide synthetase component F